MIRRLLPVLALILLPTSVWADDATPAPTDTSASTSSSLQPVVSAPQAGGSSGDSGALQPAGGAGLGSSSSAATGLVAPTGNALQGTTNAGEQIRQLLNSEADGAPQQPANATDTNEVLLDAGLLALLIVAGLAGWLVRRRQLVQAHARFGHPDLDR